MCLDGVSAACWRREAFSALNLPRDTLCSTVTPAPRRKQRFKARAVLTRLLLAVRMEHPPYGSPHELTGKGKLVSESVGQRWIVPWINTLSSACTCGTEGQRGQGPLAGPNSPGLLWKQSRALIAGMWAALSSVKHLQSSVSPRSHSLVKSLCRAEGLVPDVHLSGFAAGVLQGNAFAVGS